MKRLLSILLCLILTVSLCACGGPDSPEPTPDPEPEKDYAEELYDTLKGVWVRNDSTLSFLIIDKSEGKVCYTAGIPMSDYVFGGPVDEVTRTGDTFYFTVHVPERPTTELSDGWAAYDIAVKVDVSRLDEYIINANDHAHSGELADFMFYNEDTENFTFDALFAGNEVMPEIDPALRDELFNQVWGVWLHRGSAGEPNFFCIFEKSEGEYCVTEGIPASGFAMGGAVVFIEKAGNDYNMIVNVPERHDTGEGAEMDYDEMNFDVTLTINDDGTITFNLFGDKNQRVVFSYECESWDKFDWDSYYESLGG